MHSFSIMTEGEPNGLEINVEKIILKLYTMILQKSVGKELNF